MVLRRPKLDGFFLALVAAIAVAFLAPHLASRDGLIPASKVGAVGVALIFFLHGASLSLADLRAGLMNWRLHASIHATTFVFFPLVGTGLYFATAGFLPHEARVGLFYLSALPSTISSSVAMTAAGRGNVPAAMFNATLSGMLGLVLTPLLVSWCAKGAHGLDLTDQILSVARSVLAPFVVGQLLQPWMGKTLRRHKPWLGKIDRGVIVLIVLGSFSESVAAGAWRQYSWAIVLEIAGIVTALLAAALAVTTMVSRNLKFSRADKVTAVFCGSKKSLVNGAPMATAIFGAGPALAMIMLPLLLYHQIQLLVCAVLAQRFAAEAEAVPSAEPACASGA
jgi:solute carrier family 10 (sodium/bile acid cotransporter), member 7